MNVGKQKIALGCYTDEANPNGLKVLELDEGSGAMSVVAERPVSNALYQALSSDGKYLYSCTGEGLASFRAEGLEPVDSISLGSCVCHVSAMPDGKRVAFADYLGGFAGSVEVADGRFGQAVRHQHSGCGPNLPRQDKAHCHQAIPVPGGKGYCVVDLGLDQIVEYPSGRVFRTFPSGAGPRHLLFHPNGRLAFLVYELGNLVSSLSWSPAEGFKIIDTYSTIIDFSRKEQGGAPSRCATMIGGAGNSTSLGVGRRNSQAAAIRFTPDGRRVVVSNRGENSLAVFDFDEASGKLAFKARTMLAGDWPRDFAFVNDRLALVAMERSGDVSALGYDAASGAFSEISSLHGLYRPSSVCPLP